MIFGLVGPGIFFVTPIVLARVDVNKALAILIQKDPSLEFLTQFKDRLILYNNLDSEDFWIRYVACLLLFTMILIIFGAMIIMCLITYFTLKQTAIMSRERYTLSVMLLRVMILQVVGLKLHHLTVTQSFFSS